MHRTVSGGIRTGCALVLFLSFPAGAHEVPPLPEPTVTYRTSHEGEEAHVLLEGSILYALGDDVFTMEAPYIVNIPPMVPHSFLNLGEDVAQLVVIFPTNVWEYDVLDYFPFEDLEAAKKKAAAAGAK